LETGSVRVHLAGRVSIEVNGCLLDQSAFAGQQGRVAFAYLVCERSRPVSRTELTEALWRDDIPPSAETALNAIISKLRSLLGRAGLTGAEALMSGPGCYELRLPPAAWIDLEAASDAIHDAEFALRAGDAALAYGPSAVAHHIARRPFLPGEDAPWIDARRARLRGILLRALECRAEVYIWNHEFSLAIEAARELTLLEPLRESGHRLLIRALAAAGNSAEALWAYEQCRQHIAAQLGVDPSRQTKAVYEQVLQSL
jgi:DNA-binding SARP family transcriptional activator